MLLQRLTITDFRCLSGVELVPGERFNLIHGKNASGKTSLLEAIGFFARGKSFLGAPARELVRHGATELLLQGRVNAGARRVVAGVGYGPEGLHARVDGGPAGGAELAAMLPLQIIGPNVHELVAGAPEARRRYLDGIAFHVEPAYLDHWRRFRRALKQRNAALRAGVNDAGLASWDREFIESAERVDGARRLVAKAAGERLVSLGQKLLRCPIGVEYRQGWAGEGTLADSLAAGRERDREAGSTQAGPQRADLRLIMDERQARRLVSRGQQKLLASALVLCAAELVKARIQRPLLLLLDDPAAELDGESLQDLLDAVCEHGGQVIATALAAEVALFPEPPVLFHVERGALRKQS